MTPQEFAQYIKPFVEAMANGETVQEFFGEEFQDKHNANFIEGREYRIKPRTIVVNGFDVPEPMLSYPEHRTQYFCAAPDRNFLCFESVFMQNDEVDANRLHKGLLHTTKEAAIAHAKAMLGIDPYAD